MSKPDTIKIDDVEYIRKDQANNELKDMIEDYQSMEYPFNIGGKYFIRTVTHYFTGQLVAVYDQEIVLRDVSWIANTGRYHNAMQTWSFDEVEPYPPGSPVIIGRGSIIDAYESNLLLPRETK